MVELEGLMTSTPGQKRHQGFLDGIDLAHDPGVQIVFQADMQWLEPDARREMESALATQSEIDLVYAHNDPGAHGAWLAAKQAGRVGGAHKMMFVGIDALPHEGVEYVKQGILDATFLYPTGGADAGRARAQDPRRREAAEGRLPPHPDLHQGKRRPRGRRDQVTP